MREHWEANRQYIVSGLKFRTVRGSKDSRTVDPDVRLDVWNGREWVPVSMGLSFFLAEFHYEIEDRLYPPALGNLGGQMFLDHLSKAVVHGWQYALELLQEARGRKRGELVQR